MGELLRGEQSSSLPVCISAVPPSTTPPPAEGSAAGHRQGGGGVWERGRRAGASCRESLGGSGWDVCSLHPSRQGQSDGRSCPGAVRGPWPCSDHWSQKRGQVGAVFLRPQSAQARWFMPPYGECVWRGGCSLPLESLSCSPSPWEHCPFTHLLRVWVCSRGRMGEPRGGPATACRALGWNPGFAT